MFLLPKGKPLAENVSIAKLQLPDALDKLKNGKLTGYATFIFHAADCALIYEDGKLSSALLHRDKSELKDEDAVRALTNLMFLADNCSFNAYSLSKSAVKALLALVRGDKIINNQELKHIDFKGLLERIKNEHMTATLKIYTDQRIGMILYRDGVTVGFFHDTSQTIETTAGDIQQIAALPGAAFDLNVLKEEEQLPQDLAEIVNVRTLWKSVKGDDFTTTEPERINHSPSVPASQLTTVTTNSAEIESIITAIANSFLGKLGKTIIEKELASVGGIKALTNETKSSEFLSAVEKSSKLLASISKIKEMCTAISAEVAKL